jgi:uncharacterized protein
MGAEAGAFHFSPRPNRAADIHWRTWSAAAFEEARSSGRPMLLSISAVWCHWCHVMDETTYSRPDVIDIINREYVPVRVDNDVRPDINQRYNMGGWPTTAFLTSSGDILTGGTYLPPDQMASALTRVASYYRANQAEIAGQVLEARRRSAAELARGAGALDARLVDGVLDSVKRAYDPEYGGFGPAPKFPQTDALLLLLEQSMLREEPELRRMAVHTLERMTRGGTYDQVEGGFFRYSTTQDWSVPHFEKMLEDHGGLVLALSLAGMTAELDRTMDYLDRVLRDPQTGLYAGSQDADEHYYSLDADGRAALPPPYVDRRVFTAWNAGLLVAYLDVAVRHDRPPILEAARAWLDALLRHAETSREEEGAPQLLGDQAWLLLATMRAFEAGLGSSLLQTATALADRMQPLFADSERGGYFDHAGGQDLGRLGDRIKPLAENSVAAIALLELAAATGNPDSPYRERARRALESVAALPPRYGLMAAVFARALDRLPHELTVATGDAGLARASREAHPYVVVKPEAGDQAVVCAGTICLAPVSTPEEVTAAIRQATATVG